MGEHIDSGISSDLYASALNSIGTGAVITDQDATILYVNKAFEEITGYTIHEAKGQKISLLKSGYQSKDFYAELWEAIQGVGKWTGTLWNKRKNGEIYHERLSIRRFTDTAETYYVGIFSDISEQDELQRALIDAQKRELMVTMIGGIAHNFNNYMAAIQGLAYLGNKSAQDEKTKHYLAEIHQVTDRNSHLVQNLMKISRPSTNTDISFDLVNIVQHSTDTAKSILPESINVIVELPDSGDCWIKGDSADVEQVLFNLINNARDALQNIESPKITIGVLPTCKKPDICQQHCPKIGFCQVNTEKNVIIKVEDNGIGIPEEMQDKIFTPFFTTKEPDKGTGLGLASVNQVVNRIGGAIWLTSRANVGTRFSVCLPRMDKQ